MANEKKATYKVYAGVDSNNNPIWDVYHFATSAGQVGETNGSLNFLRPNTHKVNGKSFWNGTAHQGITLYGSNIDVSETDGTKISAKITSMNQTIGGLETAMESIQDDLDAIGTDLGDVIGSLETLNTSYAGLDANGKIHMKHIPDSILGQVNYCGLFDAKNNVATLASSTGGSTSTKKPLPTNQDLDSNHIDPETQYIPTLGDYFICTVAGSLGEVELEVGDWLIYNGITSGWGKIDNSDAVSSVAGLTGAITAASLVNALKTELNNLYFPLNSNGPLQSNIVITGDIDATNITAANTVTAVDGDFENLYASGEMTLDGVDVATVNDIPKIFTGSTKPTGAKTGDIWLEY